MENNEDTVLKISEIGNYVLHLRGNDYSKTNQILNDINPLEDNFLLGRMSFADDILNFLRNMEQSNENQ